MRMTTFIIGIVIVTLVMTSFGLILTDITTKYPSGGNYTASDMESFEQMKEIDNLTSQIKNRIENQSTDRSVADVIGGFVADGKDTLLLSAKSYDLLETMADDGMGKVNLPNTFKVAFYVVMLVLVFLGIILGTILGRRL